ncbi:MAG: CoA transferase [Candidatus Rokubacteria bacterium]|nr:CoA transferase [Candidatus Rokubacteria bacterium]
MTDDRLTGGKRGRPPWPATPVPTPEEVYSGLAEPAREYPGFLESIVHPRKTFEKPEALGRIRVLDCTTGMIIGHWCSSQLAELGAEAIQLEPPGGDPLRRLTPFGRKAYMVEDAERGEPVGLHFLHEMRNKLAITLDLEKPKGREVLKRLLPHVDVLIENAPPGRFDRWGIGYRQLSRINPRLVYCWVGQRGQWGPLKDRPGMRDPVAQAACGFVHGTGDPKEFGGRPTRSGMWMADHVGGTAAAMGIVAALLHRERVSGKGQFIEATAAEGVIRILDYNWVWHGMDGSIRPRYGNWDLAINIYAVNPCKDGYMMVGGGHDRLWYRIWRTVGDEVPEAEEEIIADPNLRNVSERLPHTRQVKTYTLLCEWLKENTRAQAERKLIRQEVASGGVQAVHEVAEYPHFKYRGQVAEFVDRLYGPVLVATSPMLAEKTPARLKWLGRPVGYDNEEVYRRLLGYTREELERLARQGVI